MTARRHRERRAPGPPGGAARERTSGPSTATADPRHLAWWQILTIAVVAALLRAVVAVQLARTPLYRWPQLDALEFLSWARQIAHGDFSLAPYPTHGPLYPLFLGALLRLTGESLLAVRLFQAAIGALSCALIGSTAARLFGRAAGLAAGLLVAVYAPLVLVDTQLWEEIVFLPLCAVVLFLVARERQTLATAAGVGAALGLAAVARPTALVLLPLVLFVLWRRCPRRLAAIGLALTVVVAAVAPAVAAASRASGGFVFVRGYAAINAWIGNDPQSGGVQNARLGGAWDRLEAEPYRAGCRTPAEIERYFSRKTLRRIAGDPVGFVRVLASKATWLLQSEEVRDNHSFDFFVSQAPLLGWLPGFGVLLPLALCGAWFAARERRLPWAVATYVALFAATAVLLLYGMRYRLPIVPGVAVFAGAGLWGLVDAARAARSRRAVRELAVPALLLLGGAVLAHVRRYPANRNFSEEWALSGAALEEGGELDQAEQAFARARDADPRSALGWDGLGRLRVRQGRWTEAAAAFEQAVARDPDYRRSHYHLALVDVRQGRPDDAERELRAALAISPNYALCLVELGALRLARGDGAGAEDAYRQALAIEPRSARALRGVAQIAGARGRPRDGLADARRATELEPDSAEGWFLLGSLAVDAGEVAAAEEALTALRGRRGEDAPEVLLLSGGLAYLRQDHTGADLALRRLMRTAPSPQAAALFLRNADAMGQRAAAEAWLAALRSAG